MEHNSLRDLFEGKLGTGPRSICKVRRWKWASVSIGASLLDNMEGYFFRAAYERRGTFLYLGHFDEEFE
jgi:hypothetical protein